MYVANVTDDFNIITLFSYTDILKDYDNITLSNGTNNENNFDIIIPILLFTIPCDLSFLCLLSLTVFTLIEHLFNNK